MRTAIRKQIENSISELAGRIYDMDADISLPLPLCIIRQGEETAEYPWNGYRCYFEVILYGSGFAKVDQLSEQIIEALHEKVLVFDTGNSLTCRYTGNPGGDMVNVGRTGASRTLRFAAMKQLAYEKPDQEPFWLAGLQEWTQETAGDEWTVYTGWWPTGYIRPCILWRLSGSELVMTNTSVLDVDNRLSVHVIGRSPEEEQSMVNTLIEAIGRQVKLPLDASHQHHYLVKECATNLEADRIASGQISVVLRMKTSKKVEAKPLMNNIHYSEEPKY
ncbi:hypothetical protein EJP77_04995 [Paenibacillus zeisoli]|uniref:Uncharacterized protein n=1 Tax=Paenibacillus zeisoli TaxID=2496267 RepID=A0A3S1DE69_9BACL|nr:hypothetical protein [Paenibacillus zeisoli]RUT36343.1 hypothetical protein EJP77_04995 [Paenibacillus zeisoli]